MTDPAQPQPQRKRPLAAWCLLALVLVFHTAANLWWLGADNHVHWLDEQVHLEKARAVHEALFLQEGGPVSRLKTAFLIPPGNPAHPPLLYFAGALAMGLSGYGTDNMTAVNTLFFLLLLLGVYFLVRGFLSPSEAATAVAAVSLMPGLAVSSRYFMTDYPAACLVVWAVLALVRSGHYQKTRWVLAFAVFNALALLTRTVTPVYYLAPLLWVAGAGAWKSLRGGYGSSGRFALHLLLTAAVALVIAGPWYAVHRDAFLGYWVGHRASDMPPFAFVEPAAPAPANQEAAPAPMAAPGPEKAPAQAAAPKVQPRTGLAARLLQPRVPWSRYPVFVINNGMFLLPFLLSLAGMALAVTVPRFRRGSAGMLLVWVLGCWLLFTLLFRFGTPRYAVPVLAPLGVLSVLPLLLLPRWVRGPLLTLYFAVLFAPWFMLTVVPRPALAECRLPWRPDPRSMAGYDEHGLYLCKDRLTMGFAYSWLGAPVRDSYQDRIFLAMLREEKKRRRAPGQYAPYAVVNLRGFGFQDRHFWPEPNPYRRRDLPEDARVDSRISLAAHRNTVMELEPFLEDLDYVVFAMESARKPEAGIWIGWLAQRGFRALDHIWEPRRATIPACHFYVFARIPEAAPAPASPEEVEALGIVELFQALNAPGAFSTDALQSAAVERLTRLLAEADQNAPAVAGSLALSAHAWVPRPAGGHRLYLVFKVNAPAGRGWTLALGGRDADGGDLGQWRFSPTPPLHEWEPGGYQMVNYDPPAADKPLARVVVGAIGPDGQPLPGTATLPGPESGAPSDGTPDTNQNGPQ
ncbi:MAG: glycosyltransferase family 39 protein [Candidatus Hydrogenedentes bacterium]|nr:glycosyltransferase family 39 protein [Candidatus Hydrogenedentota bacterium]